MWHAKRTVKKVIVLGPPKCGKTGAVAEFIGKSKGGEMVTVLSPGHIRIEYGKFPRHVRHIGSSGTEYLIYVHRGNSHYTLNDIALCQYKDIAIVCDSSRLEFEKGVKCWTDMLSRTGVEIFTITNISSQLLQRILP